MSKIGISVAMLSPFDDAGALDTGRLAAHAVNLLKAGVHGVTLYGTTGEGPSINAQERAQGLSAVLDAGVPANVVTLGIYANSVADAVAQIKQGYSAGIRSFLVPPPFYFPQTSDDGLFAWFSELIEATDADADIILYHIPQVTNVPLSANLVGRLLKAYPDRIRAVKDSSANWPTTEAFMGVEGLPVLVGDERLLHRAVALGGVGSICGCSNLYPERLVKIFKTAEEDVELNRIITAIVSLPVMPALKALMEQATGDAAWGRLRAPLEPLTAEQAEGLLKTVAAEPVDG